MPVTVKFHHKDGTISTIVVDVNEVNLEQILLFQKSIVKIEIERFYPEQLANRIKEAMTSNGRCGIRNEN